MFLLDSSCVAGIEVAAEVARRSVVVQNLGIAL